MEISSSAFSIPLSVTIKGDAGVKGLELGKMGRGKKSAPGGVSGVHITRTGRPGSMRRVSCLPLTGRELCSVAAAINQLEDEAWC